MSLRRILPARYGLVQRKLNHINKLVDTLITNCEILVEGLEYDRTELVKEQLDATEYTVSGSTSLLLENTDASLDVRSNLLKEEANKAFHRSPDIWGWLVGWIADCLTEIFNAVTSGATQLGASVSSWLTNAITTGANYVKNAYTTIKNGVTNAFNAITSSVNKAVWDMWKWSMGAIEAAEDFLSPLGYALSLGFNALATTLRSLLSFDIADLMKMQTDLAKALEEQQIAAVKARIGAT